MNQQITKNQHFIPQCLLKNFASNKNLFFRVYLKEKKIKTAGLKNSMCKKFTYEDSRLPKNTVENYFQKIETNVAPKFEEIIKSINKYKKGESDLLFVKEQIYGIIPESIIFYYRSGALLKEFSSDHSGYKIPNLLRKILHHPYINQLTKTIKDCYKFAILESDSNFLLSDQFLSTSALKIKNQFSNVSNRHIGLKETLILLPISSNYYVAFWHSESHFFIKENCINSVNDEEVVLINKSIINNSYEESIAQKKEDLEKVLDLHKEEHPSQVYMGFNDGYVSGAIRKKEVFFYDEDREAYNFLQFPPGIAWKCISIKRNDPCPCSSGKKFKKCHESLFERIKIPIQNLVNQKNIKQDIYSIPDAMQIEMPIEDWGGYPKNL